VTARLFLVAHASTAAVRRTAFAADEPLDDHGQADAAALVGHLPRADVYAASPELRTRQTAEALRLDATVLPLLHDCDFGNWRGRTFEDVSASEPDAVAAWLRDPTAAPHGGESIADLVQRIGEWLAQENGHHRQSIVVTNPSIIRAAVVHAIGATPQSFWRIDIAPLSITRLSGTNGRWNLVSVGCHFSDRI
jgi:broad specificity phosphatase PhoE